MKRTSCAASSTNPLFWDVELHTRVTSRPKRGIVKFEFDRKEKSDDRKLNLAEDKMIEMQSQAIIGQTLKDDCAIIAKNLNQKFRPLMRYSPKRSKTRA